MTFVFHFIAAILWIFALVTMGVISTVLSHNERGEPVRNPIPLIIWASVFAIFAFVLQVIA